MVKANGMCRGLYPLLAQHPSREAGLGSVRDRSSALQNVLGRERFSDQLHENFVVERFREEGKGSCFDGGLARQRIIAPGKEYYLGCR